jgi:peptidoglycan/xylan/chitin deacetylase (PgdA/CDA1 family)
VRAILTYHSIDSSGSPVSVAPRDFDRHVRWLATGRVRVVALEDLVAVPPEEHAVALTFDDGFANFATEAAPRLREHDLPATLFVVSGHAGRTNAWGGRDAAGIPTLPLLDWDALGRVAEGGIAIGAHTRTHARLERLDAGAATAEIAGSADEIAQRLGRRPTTFAYPYGAVSRTAAEIARAHFACAVTTAMRTLRSGEDRAMLPRLDAWYFRDPARLEAWGSARFNAHLRARALVRRAGGWLARA